MGLLRILPVQRPRNDVIAGMHSHSERGACGARSTAGPSEGGRRRPDEAFERRRCTCEARPEPEGTWGKGGGKESTAELRGPVPAVPRGQPRLRPAAELLGTGRRGRVWPGAGRQAPLGLHPEPPSDAGLRRQRPGAADLHPWRPRQLPASGTLTPRRPARGSLAPPRGAKHRRSPRSCRERAERPQIRRFPLLNSTGVPLKTLLTMTCDSYLARHVCQILRR